MESAALGANPLKGDSNCGYIIDAVTARLWGNDPNAIAKLGLDGSWDAIETRYNTQFSWGGSLEDAYKRVAAGGDGTMALVGMKFPDGNAHVVVIVNDRGKVGIVEGQKTRFGTPGVVDNLRTSNNIYNSTGHTRFGFAIIKPMK